MLLAWTSPFILSLQARVLTCSCNDQGRGPGAACSLVMVIHRVGAMGGGDSLWVHCCCSVTQSCPTLCDPMDCSTPGLPVLHCLPEFAQIHVHWVGDAIQPSHPLLPLSPLALNLSQHQGLFWTSQFFASGGQSIGASTSESVPPMNIQSWFHSLAIFLGPRNLSPVVLWRRIWLKIVWMVCGSQL